MSAAVVAGIAVTKRAGFIEISTEGSDPICVNDAHVEEFLCAVARVDGRGFGVVNFQGWSDS